MCSETRSSSPGPDHDHPVGRHRSAARRCPAGRPRVPPVLFDTADRCRKMAAIVASSGAGKDRIIEALAEEFNGAVTR